jgi:DNA repair exonuclease SbcCD ATPase subunit
VIPAFDCSLQVIVIMFATAGLAAMTAEEDPRPAMSRQEIEQEILVTSAKTQALSDMLHRERAEATGLEQDLEQARSRRADVAATRAALETGGKQVEELRRERESLQKRLQECGQRVSQFEQQRRDLERNQSDLAQKERQLEQNRRQAQQDRERLQQLQQQVAELDKQLQELGAAHAQLREKIAAEQRKAQAAPTVSVEAKPRFLSDTKREPVLFVIYQGTVTPVDKPHYRFMPAGDGRVAAIRDSAGETADQALTEGSAFLQAAAKIDRQKQFAALLVDKASFETFRTLRDELRKRQIMTGWEPLASPNLGLVAQGGTSVGPQ